jgi:hypothetical protein
VGTATQQLSALKAISLLLFCAISSGLFFWWLRQAWLLLAVAISGLLLMSGGLLPSLKHPLGHAAVIGAVAGAFIGSLVGVTPYIQQ